MHFILLSQYNKGWTIYCIFNKLSPSSQNWITVPAPNSRWRELYFKVLQRASSAQDHGVRGGAKLKKSQKGVLSCILELHVQLQNVANNSPKGVSCQENGTAEMQEPSPSHMVLSQIRPLWFFKHFLSATVWLQGKRVKSKKSGPNSFSKIKHSVSGHVAT